MSRMLRHYFIGNSLDDLELFEQQLEAAGVATSQIHVLSRDDAEVARHRLHAVQSFMKQDVVFSAVFGAVVGLGASVLALVVAYGAGWTRTAAGWLPFVLLAIVLLGFCTWVGGLIGIQTPNRRFRRFGRALGDGRHVFFVDLAPSQETVLRRVLASHPAVELAGTGSAVPGWFVAAQEKLRRLRQALRERT